MGIRPRYGYGTGAVLAPRQGPRVNLKYRWGSTSSRTDRRRPSRGLRLGQPSVCPTALRRRRTVRTPLQSARWRRRQCCHASRSRRCRHPQHQSRLTQARSPKPRRRLAQRTCHPQRRTRCDMLPPVLTATTPTTSVQACCCCHRCRKLLIARQLIVLTPMLRWYLNHLQRCTWSGKVVMEQQHHHSHS